MRWATCARRSTSCATTRPRRGGCSRGRSRCTGPTGETNTLELRGARAVRLHLALELSARHLHRPGGGGAGGRQPGAGQARRADADRRLSRRPAAARGGRAAERAASAARRRRGRRGARQGPARGRRRLHRLQRDGLGDQRGAGGAARRHRALHRRDRRHQRHDRRLERAARAGDPRRGALGLRLGGTALLGGAPVLRAGGRGRAA